MVTTSVICISIIVAVFGLVSCQRTYNHGVNLPSSRPLNIAHRGASGVLPEHTKEAYTRAIEDGADVIECDLAVTLDAHLICRHDLWLSSSTNIEDHPEFADRKQTVTINYYGAVRNITDWFSTDLTLSEIKTLRVKQTNSERDPSFNDKYDICTFDEFIEIAQSADRDIAIYPELKYPSLVNSLNLFNGSSYEEFLVEKLRGHGYSKATDACFLQSFEFPSLQALQRLTDLPLVMLLDQASDGLLKQYSEICYGIGMWKCGLVDHYGPNGYKNWIRNISDLADRVHALGMRIHLYTFRNEASNLAWDYEQDPRKEYDFYMEMEIDGYFTDFPQTFARYLEDMYRTGEKDCLVSDSSGIHFSWLCLHFTLLLWTYTMRKWI